MKIRRVELREIRMTLLAPFETSFDRTQERRILLVRVFDEDGCDGWGECTAPEHPFYNHEFLDGAWLILRTYLIPRLLGQRISSPDEVFPLFRAVRGHRMAKAALEVACWDLQAKREGKPLWQVLGGTRRKIECGVSIGIQPSLSELVDKVRRELAAGYRRIKVKIKPGVDYDILHALRREFPTIPLMADANSAYSLADRELLRRFDDFHLMMLEQPLAHDDLVDHATLQKELRTPICLDESIRSPDDARRAVALGACRIINVKLGRVGGYAEAKRINDFCRQEQIPLWCGGMLESGVGRAHNIALSTLDGFSLPGDVSASKRYWEQDIIDPPVEVAPDGTIEAPMTPGIGYQVNERRVARLTTRHEVFEL
ncbi:MAG TPA: o-succinylbenzoate synthase [Blastocatellia bacterium]|nr:o-succinylbenzoate synthase [Blastocatellia bacterium]